MIDFIRNWITSITAAAIIVSVCTALTPKGSMKKYTQFTGGLVLLLVIASPVYKLDMSEFLNFPVLYGIEAGNFNYETENTEILKSIIQEKSESYILVKASELEIDCGVKVTTKTHDGYPYPDSVTITLKKPAGSAVKAKLAYFIESDFAIPPERQFWE